MRDRTPNRASALSIYVRCRDGAGGYFDESKSLIVRGEDRLFIFLQIALITGRQSLERDEKRHQRAYEPASLAARQFPGIGIFFLRHQAAAGSVFVRQK